MDHKKSYIPIKVFISYLAIIALVVTVGWILYTENSAFSLAEDKISEENTKVLKVGNLLTSVYKTENFGRITIQSTKYQDFQNYLDQERALRQEIDSFKIQLKSRDQIMLLDSVKGLLRLKTENIVELKRIKRQATDEIAMKRAINNMGKMQESLRKLRLNDFVKNTSKLSDYERRVYGEYVDYMNQNIKEDSTNTLSKKKSDSLLAASKKLLYNVRSLTEKKNATLYSKEISLLKNELLISEKLRKVLSVIEAEIILNTTKKNAEKELALKKTNNVVMTAAIIGLVLTLFFSILILTDFSKTQSYKKRLEIANERTSSLLQNREQLITTVSHDLKTPLSTIIGYTELLNGSSLNKKQEYYTKNIQGSSEYISKLVQDLLDFTKIEAGKIVIEPVAFSLGEVIREVANSVQSVYQSKPIELMITVEKCFDTKVISDPFRLRQILTNIIGNAYKFTEKGFIKINAVCIGNEIRITIEDSGIGIKEENLNLVFQEFTQADNTIEKSYGGTGLGLTISKKMAEILGGQLSLSSHYGKGSTFSIVLPLEFDDSVAVERAETTTQKIDKLTAIVVDDDESLLRLTTEVLKQKGFTVRAFSRAQDALNTIDSTAYDFVITDIQMPEMDGFELLENIKKSENHKDQPVFAVTGRGDLETEEYHQAGFAAVIRKPFSPTVLLDTIYGIFGKPQLSATTTTSASIKNNSKNQHYSLDSLITFLPDDGDALRDVLQSFEKTTLDNLVILEKAVQENDTVKLKEISHRMGPMFRQISTNEIGKLLETMELHVDSAENAATLLADLKQKTTELFELFRKDSVI